MESFSGWQAVGEECLCTHCFAIKSEDITNFFFFFFPFWSFALFVCSPSTFDIDGVSRFQIVDFYYDITIAPGEVEHKPYWQWEWRGPPTSLYHFRGKTLSRSVLQSAAEWQNQRRNEIRRKMHGKKNCFVMDLDGKIMLGFNQNLLHMDKWFWFGVVWCVCAFLFVQFHCTSFRPLIRFPHSFSVVGIRICE